MAWSQIIRGTLKLIMLELLQRRRKLGYQPLAPPWTAQFVAILIPSPSGGMPTSPASNPLAQTQKPSRQT
jgi:hypothetical protein